VPARSHNKLPSYVEPLDTRNRQVIVTFCSIGSFFLRGENVLSACMLGNGYASRRVHLFTSWL